MRKHNTKFAQRWARSRDDRTNFPQVMAHDFVKSKQNQLLANGLLGALLKRIGIDVHKSHIDKLIEKLRKLETMHPTPTPATP